MAMITAEPFGATKAGEPVTRWTLQNSAGMSVRIISYACAVQSITVPDRNGDPIDVALGYDDLAGYEAGSCFFGAFVGRYANRIKGAAFELNGRRYTLEKNQGNNHLHGAYCHQVFDGSVENDTLVFRRVSPDGEEGYPGTLRFEVRYTLREDNALVIDYRAETDADTVVNFTNHTYFNLNGTGDILNHRLTLAASRFTEGDTETLPTGNILPVDGTPMDFRGGKVIGEGIASDYGQVALCRGYDHNFILDTDGILMRQFAEAEGDVSGIRLKAYTTQPAVQLYTGNYVDDDSAPHGKGGVRYPRYAGFCLETQHYPCSPNYPQFPSTVLRPGETYRHTTIYRFMK
ncbi:MAG: galactose mutarotase [Oscillospiraceae bacterium]|nr:galactose mutarotase [Oscillospiraceae bacterium]